MDATLELLQDTGACALYSIQFSTSDITEFEKFVKQFRSEMTYNRDFNLIITAINHIVDHGALERYFRTEGKYSDRVGALPIDKSFLRLYCIRLSNSVLILGGGGIKHTATYEEDQTLMGHVLTLQNLDRIIRNLQRKGIINVSEKRIEGIDTKLFNV